MVHHYENENYFTETKAVINQILNILIMITSTHQIVYQRRKKCVFYVSRIIIFSLFYYPSLIKYIEGRFFLDLQSLRN